MSRELLYFEIIHQSSETGLDKVIARHPGYSSVPEEERMKTLEAIEHIYEDMWQYFNNELERLDFDVYSAVKVYQDSVIRVPKKIKYPSEKNYNTPPLLLKNLEKSNAEGSKNAKTICSLLKKGATLEVTESPIWWNCYTLYTRIPYVLYRMPILPERILEPIEQFLIGKRDNAIACIIDKTLKDGELGILFMGGNHEVDFYLPDDIEVRLYELNEEETFDKLEELYLHLAGEQ